MSTRTDAIGAWSWVTSPAKSRSTRKPGHQELWAGAVYLMVWSVLWLAVVVTVLAPLDGLFAGGP